MNKSKIVYRLEVLRPGSIDDALYKIESDQPFPALAVGDIFRYDGSGEGMTVGEVARVSHFTYIIGETYFHEMWVFLKTSNAFESSDETRKLVFG
ncbi:hypothetical protein [Inquilinus sp. OTU3971]|uniref:hypothetical protein n=1 Tax=Inquilinus sp. OTU3971 TaxID=3043855 RepID=UPI00313C393B